MEKRTRRWDMMDNENIGQFIFAFVALGIIGIVLFLRVHECLN
jgi:hypothetical protein